MEKLTLTELKRYIKKRIKHNLKTGSEAMSFLGLVENRELTPEVNDLFYSRGWGGTAGGWDWVNGNENLKKLVMEATNELKARNKEVKRILSSL